jgi:hypothetical protein
MIVPNKYENLSQNIFEIGKDIVMILKKSNYDIYSLYKNLLQKRKDEFETSLNKFLISLDLLYCFDVIHIRGEEISLK